MEKKNQQVNEPKYSSKKMRVAVFGLIIIPALVVGGGVYAWQRSVAKNEKEKATANVTNNFKKQILSLQEQVEELKKKTNGQEQSKNTIEGEKVLYRSSNHGLEFLYWINSDNGQNIIYERNNKIYALEPVPERYKEAYCDENDECIFISNKPYSFSTGVITVFEKSESETFEQAILQLIQENGKDPENCKVDIVKHKDGDESAYIELANEYVLTKEDYAQIKKDEAKYGPDPFAEKSIVAEKTVELCSSYVSTGVPGIRFFISDKNKTEKKFAFFSSTGIDATIIDPESIKFIDKTTN